MSYQLYRSMSLGESLQAALDDLIKAQHITPELALKVSVPAVGKMKRHAPSLLM